MRSSSLLHQHGQRVRLHQRNDARCGGRGTSVDLFNAVLGMLAIRPFGGCRLSTICKSSAAHHRVLEPSSTTSEWNPDHGSPVRKPHRDHRRRRHRLQHCLSPDQARPARRRVAGAAAAHAWRDLARRGTRRPAAQQQQPHAARCAIRPSSTASSRPKRGRRPAGTAWAACVSPRPPPAGRSSNDRRRWPRASAFTSSSSRRNRRASFFRLLEPAGVVGAAWIEGDGYVDPTSLTNAYAAGARAGGAQLIQGVTVTAIKKRDRRVTTVVTDQGEIETECVINAGGMWGREIAAMVGTRVPACAVEHQYLRHRKDRTDSRQSAHAARSRWQFLRQAGAWCARRGRLGVEHLAVGRRRHCQGFRPGIAAARLRSFCAARRGGVGANSVAERSGHPAAHQRPDPDHAGRRADHRLESRARQLLPVLRLYVRNRRVRRRGLRDGKLDR